MTMKTSPVVTLLATISFTALVTASARADGFFNTDSKHSFSLSHTRSQEPAINPDYAKFVWMTADGQPTVSVNHIVVSLADQRLYAYHGQQLVAWSNISSGKPGHETPTGDYTVSEKDVDHHSSLYDNAPMPYFMRLTDEGVGLHAGQLPGYPASHGCVRLPLRMARDLYQEVEPGTPVEIVDSPVNMNIAQPPATATHLAQN